MAKGMEAWGRAKARTLYADGGGVADKKEVVPERTFGAGSSFLSKDAPKRVRELVGGKASGGRLDKHARGGSIKKADGGNVKPIKPEDPKIENLLPLRYSSKYGRSPATQGGMDTWIKMGGKRENYKHGGKARKGCK